MTRRNEVSWALVLGFASRDVWPWCRPGPSWSKTAPRLTSKKLFSRTWWCMALLCIKRCSTTSATITFCLMRCFKCLNLTLKRVETSTQKLATRWLMYLKDAWRHSIVQLLSIDFLQSKSFPHTMMRDLRLLTNKIRKKPADLRSSHFLSNNQRYRNLRPLNLQLLYHQLAIPKKTSIVAVWWSQNIASANLSIVLDRLHAQPSHPSSRSNCLSHRPCRWLIQVRGASPWPKSFSMIMMTAMLVKILLDLSL